MRLYILIDIFFELVIVLVILLVLLEDVLLLLKLLLMLLCRKRHLLFSVYLERVVWVKIIDESLQLLNLRLDGLGCFEILPADRLLLPKLKHIQITSDQLQFVCNLFQLHRHVIVFCVDGFLFLLEQYL